MNLNYNKDISDIRNNIITLNSSLNSIIDNIPEKKVIKNIQGNKYELSQFQFKVSSLNYKRNIMKNIGRNPEKINKVDNMDELSKIIQQNDYKKSWNKLDNFQKKIKINQYVNLLESKGLVKDELIPLLRNQLLTKLKNNKLKSKKIVNYDENILTIKNISILIINSDKSFIIN